MGFNVYLHTGKTIGNIEFNKAYSTEKVLHYIQCDVLYLHDIHCCLTFLAKIMPILKAIELKLC